jgi:molybdopterin-guanine dinucleotide biosynthesis protein A
VPLLPDDLYPRLCAAAGTGAAMAATIEGRQPLCSVWPVTALSGVTAALAGGAHPPTWRLLEQIGAVQVHCDPPASFANLNTREELAHFESLLAKGDTYQR